MIISRIRKGWGQLSKGNRGLAFFMVLFVLSTAVVSFGLVIWTAVSGIDSVHEGIDKVQPVLAFWRLFLFCGLFGYWSFWIRVLARWKDLDEDQIRYALSMRWRVAMWFIIIELVIVQDVIQKFVTAFIWDGKVTL